MISRGIRVRTDAQQKEASNRSMVIKALLFLQKVKGNKGLPCLCVETVSFAGGFTIGGKENKQWLTVGNRLGPSISYKFGGRKESIPFIAYSRKSGEIFYG